MLQYGAIPWRHGPDGLEFLLVTSRRSNAWIFPKGHPMPQHTPWGTAAEEALEEAGVKGIVSPESVGTYRTVKPRLDGDVALEVRMYPLEVREELEDWPEKADRDRRWADPVEACRLLSEPDLAAMVRKLADREGPQG